MLIKDVERYTIPLTSSRESLDFDGGTTAEELIEALKKVPAKGVITTDFGQILVTHYKPDIDSEVDPVDPVLEALKRELADPYRYFPFI